MLCKIIVSTMHNNTPVKPGERIIEAEKLIKEK